MHHPEHTSRRFDAELDDIHARLLKMGSLVERQFSQALNALSTCSAYLAREVIDRDAQVNRFEVEIDEACCSIIARRQPAANDLRFIVSATKVVVHLERIGDETKKIARMAELLAKPDRLTLPRFSEIGHAATLAQSMLHEALDALARLDGQAANAIIQRDAMLNSEYHAILRHLVGYMMDNPRSISASLEILFIAKAIERIGDHIKSVLKQVSDMWEAERPTYTAE
jgi:phosphate transport system protein